jgi:hypothetical protein
MKLTTAKQAVNVASEVLESFGGAGYVEDTGLPMLLRDAQVLPIWEGTTNVLALDTLRALGDAQSLQPLRSLATRLFQTLHDSQFIDLSRTVLASLDHAEIWLKEAQARSRSHLEAGARRFALTLGRTIELALLIRHSQWAQDQHEGLQSFVAATRFARSGVDLITD